MSINKLETSSSPKLGNQSADSDFEKEKKWTECGYPGCTDKALFNINLTKKYNCMKHNDIGQNKGLGTLIKASPEESILGSSHSIAHDNQEFLQTFDKPTDQEESKDNSDFAGFGPEMKDRSQDKLEEHFCNMEEGRLNISNPCLPRDSDIIMQRDSATDEVDQVILGDAEDCEIKALVYMYSYRKYACLWHQEIVYENDHDVMHLYHIEDKHVNLVKEVIKGVIRRFGEQEDEDDPEFAQVCAKIVVELEDIYKGILNMLEDFVSHLELEEKINCNSQSENNHGEGFGAAVVAEDGYFDSETLLKLAGISQEAIGSISIIPDVISSQHNYDITIYSWQHKVRNILAELYPKIQSYCSKVTSIENFSLVNPFSLPLDDYISSKIPQPKTQDQVLESKESNSFSKNLEMKMEESPKIFETHWQQDVELTKETATELMGVFSQTEDEGYHEFIAICERAAEELEIDFQELSKVVGDCIPKPWFEAYFVYEGKLRKNIGNSVESKKNDINSYFDQETILELVFITREAIGRVFIIPNENFLKNNNGILPYFWQNRVRETLYKFYPKIQKIYSQDDNSMHPVLINHLARHLKDSTPKDLQQDSNESQEVLNPPKNSDENLKNNNRAKKCFHEDCSIKPFCYIPGLDCYYGIRHCISPGKDTYLKMYLYTISDEDFHFISTLLCIVEEHMEKFVDFIQYNIFKEKDAIDKLIRAKLSDRAFTVSDDVDSKTKSLRDNILHVFRDLEFQQQLNSAKFSKNNESDYKDALSWDAINANLSEHDLPKVQDCKQYLDLKFMFELISTTQTHFQDLLQQEDIPSYVKNMIRAYILEIFYLVQGHYKNIDPCLDFNVFILFFNAIEDFKTHKDKLKYLKLFNAEFKLNEYYWHTKFIISKFIEYQNLKELKPFLYKPQKLYDETSLNAHIPNILTVYQNFWEIRSQDSSKFSKDVSKINDEIDFYEYRKDLNGDNFIHKMGSKILIGNHFEQCKNIPFYFLPECDKTLGLLHRLDEAYCKYFRFEPLARLTLEQMADFVEIIQTGYLNVYIMLQKAYNNNKQVIILGTAQILYGMSFLISEIICKGYSSNLNLESRIGRGFSDTEIANIAVSLSKNNEAYGMGKFTLTTDFNKAEDSFKFQDRALKLQILQKFQADEVDTNTEYLNKRKKIERVIEYLESNQIYDQQTDKLEELNAGYIQDESWKLMFSKPSQQDYLFSRKNKNSMEICQGQDGKSLREIEGSSLEPEEEIVRTNSEGNGNNLIIVGRKISELRKGSCSKTKCESGIKLQNMNRESIQANKIEESKNSSDSKAQRRLEDNSSCIVTNSEQHELGNKYCHTTSVHNSYLPSDESKRFEKSSTSLKSGDDELKKLGLEKCGQTKNSEDDSQQVYEEYGHEEIKELVAEMKQKVIEDRKCGLPERFISLSHFILSKTINIEYAMIIPSSVSKFDPSKKGECKQLFSLGGDILCDKDVLMINFSVNNTLKLISQLNVRIASFDELIMDQVPEENNYVNKFLCDYFPEEGVSLGFNSSNIQKIKFGYYQEALLQAISRVSEQVIISSCKLSQAEMVNVMKEAKNLHTFRFINGELDLGSVPQFGSSLQGSKIKKLILNLADTSELMKNLHNFVEGIAQSKCFFDNLQEFELHYLGNFEEQIDEILKEYTDTEHLKIIYMKY